jgi:hypothetical protein
MACSGSVQACSPSSQVKAATAHVQGLKQEAAKMGLESGFGGRRLYLTLMVVDEQ